MHAIDALSDTIRDLEKEGTHDGDMAETYIEVHNTHTKLNKHNRQAYIAKKLINSASKY